jgi:hypothetical protein
MISKHVKLLLLLIFVVCGRISLGKRRVSPSESSELHSSSTLYYEGSEFFFPPAFNQSTHQTRRTVEQEAESHRITNLPGLDSSVSLVQYAGHLTIDESSRSNFFYWLFEASHDPLNKPLIIWLNGGPVSFLHMLLSRASSDGEISCI